RRDAEPAWSPDGSRFVFVRFAGPDKVQVMVRNADGSDLRIVGSAIGGSHPTWSPDGRRIAYSAALRCGGSAAGFVVLNWRTSEVRIICPKVPGVSPSWSPTDARIAYEGRGGVIMS